MTERPSGVTALPFKHNLGEDTQLIHHLFLSFSVRNRAWPGWLRTGLRPPEGSYGPGRVLKGDCWAAWRGRECVVDEARSEGICDWWSRQWDQDYLSGSVLTEPRVRVGRKQAQPGGTAWHVSILGLAQMLA